MIRFIQDVSCEGGAGREGIHGENRLKYLYIYFVQQTDTHYTLGMEINMYVFSVAKATPESQMSIRPSVSHQNPSASQNHSYQPS